MNKNIIQRVNNIANHIIKTNDTIRLAAKKFNISKSTVHKYLKERLLTIDINKYRKIQQIMQKHIEIRHIKGGESTRKLFLIKKASNTIKI